MSSNTSDDNSAFDAERYVVVTTTHPTTYGCNRGKNWSKAELIARSDRDATGSFETREEAIKEARRIRNKSCYFEDACEPDPNEYTEEEWEDIAEDEGGGYVFTNSDEPPYHSSHLGNWDNDEEETVDVMTRGEFEQQQEENAAFLRREGMKRRYKFTVQHKIMELQIKDAGRVHYSTPPRPFDIKAELEVVEEDAQDQPLAKLVDTEDSDRGTEIPTNVSQIKSLMYLGGRKELGQFSMKCQRANDAEIEEGLGSTPLLRILTACTSLEELHLKGIMCCTISPTFIEQIINEAPHLQRTLKVLSVGLNEVEPDALHSLCSFKAVERLDLQNCFHSFSGSASLYEPSYGYDSDSDDVYNEKPYDKGLRELADSLPNLKRLDLGYGDDNSDHLFEYMLSREVVWEVRVKLKEQNGGTLTMKDENMPEPWTSPEREEAARHHALVTVMEDVEEDEVIRTMAEEEVKTCPVCKKRAGKRCTGCKREYYCSEACQKGDYKKRHKKMCKERF